MRALLLASISALGLAACTDEGAGPSDPSQAPLPEGAPADGRSAGEPDGQAPKAVDNQIDWNAARSDFANRPSDQRNVTVQSVGQDGPAPVPMLLPSGIASVQSDRPPPAPVVTQDGYFATYRLPRYDAIVNGSQRAYAAQTQAAAGDKEAMTFTLGEASAQLAFSRYGADYLIEFECREIDGAESCITEDEAKEFADSLFVAQTR